MRFLTFFLRFLKTKPTLTSCFTETAIALPQESCAEKIRNDEKTLQSLCGVDTALFQRLESDVKPIYLTTTLRSTPRKNNRISSREKYPVSTILLLTLFWLRTYPTMTLMQILFCLHPRTLVKYLNRMVASLKVVLSSEITWPTHQEWTQHLREFNSWLPSKDDSFNGVIAVVDGTEIQISRPCKQDESQYYSAKKKATLFKYNVYCGS